MTKYSPPDTHALDFDFTRPSASIDSHALNFNFGADESIANFANLIVNTGIRLQAYGTVEQPVDIRGAANLTINTAFQLDALGSYDINNPLGLSCRTSFDYQNAKRSSKSLSASATQATHVSLNQLITYEQAITVNIAKSTTWEVAQIFTVSPTPSHEQAKKLNAWAGDIWQEASSLVIDRTIKHEVGKTLSITKIAKYEETIRLKIANVFAHEEAKATSKIIVFEWQKGLETRLKTDLPHQIARQIYYRKTYLKPWQPKPKPKYQGSTDFNFICRCEPIDSHHLDFNFGVDDCLPSIPNRNWWHIVNEVSVTRLDNDEEIIVESGNASCDRQSWCWSYSITIPASEKHKVEPIGGQPVVLKIMINGNQHLMLVEDKQRKRAFAKDFYTITGRSPTALLDSPYSATRSFLQENERTSVQLVQAEIDRSSTPDLQLEWNLIDDLGWIVPSESLSYTNGSPISAIKSVVEGGGGFVYSEPSTGTLSIKPLYKKVHWEPLQIEDYDRLLPISLITDQSTNYTPYPAYNCIYLTNDKTGDIYRVIKDGTAGDIQIQPENSSLFTASSACANYAKSKLAKSGMILDHNLQLPITSEVGQCIPAEIVAIDGDWWGIVDSVSISFTYSQVTQTVGIEQGAHDE